VEVAHSCDSSQCLLDIIHWRKYAPNETLVRQGEEPDGIFFIDKGHCKVLKLMDLEDSKKKWIKISTLGPEESFGDLSLVSSKTTLAVVAMSEVEVYIIR
jgi:CRP-like cAMP-binding protein